MNERAARTVAAASTGSLALVALSSFALFLGLAGCQGMSGPSTPEAAATKAWSQSVVTGLAGKLNTEITKVYNTAYGDPEFTGDQSPFQHILNNLRILQEDSDELHSQLAAGKGRADTLDVWGDILETARDTRTDAGWTQLPDDFRAKAEAAVGIVDQLEPFFGTP